MISFRQGWDALHQELKHEYWRPPDVRYLGCMGVASEVAMMLTSEGRKPAAQMIIGQPQPGSDKMPSIIPRPYAGRLEWAFHFISSADSIAYDPMLPEPVPLDEYPELAFIGPVLMVQPGNPYAAIEEAMRAQ